MRKRFEYIIFLLVSRLLMWRILSFYRYFCDFITNSSLSLVGRSVYPAKAFCNLRIGWLPSIDLPKKNLKNHFRYLSFAALGLLMTKVSFCQENPIGVFEIKGCSTLDENRLDTMNSISEIMLVLFRDGYPYAMVDSSVSGADGRTVYQIVCGPRFRYVEVNWTGDQIDTLSLALHTNRVYRWEEVMVPRQDVLIRLANMGYPYSRVYTRSENIRQDTLELEHTLDTVRRIYVQEVQMKGDFQMNSQLFSRMTGISSDQVFSLDRIEQSKKIIRQWDFAELVSLEFDFNPYGVNLIYDMRNSQPSRFDLLIGLVPSNQPDKQYEITGNGYLDVRNQLKMGERIYLKFDKYTNTSQAFDVQLNFPYLPFIRAGILAEGQIDRRDSTVLDVHGRFGIQYQWKPSLRYAFFLQRDQSRLTGINTARLTRQARLPEELDYNFSAAGLSLIFQRLDHQINPRQGSVFRSTLTAGLRKLVWNGQILALELPPDQPSFRVQYQELPQRTVKTEIDVSWDKFIPIGLYSTFRLRTMGGWTWTSASLFQNEHRRLGGFQDFRGFPENSFLADAYSALTAEYRFLFGVESNVYAFTDVGFLHHPGADVNWNYPYSVGVGLNLGTKAGVFGISYAVGGQRNDPLSLSQSRINFGLMVNY